MRWKTALTWAGFAAAAILVFYGAVNKWEIINAVPDDKGHYILVNPPELIEVKEFEAVKFFGGTGITHRPDDYPRLNKYTGVCFA
jgi:hypothetical protein